MRGAGPGPRTARALGLLLCAACLASGGLGEQTALAGPAKPGEPERARGRGALYAGPVGADLAQTKTAWERAGQVFTLPPRLVVRGTPVPLGLPEAATDAASAACATVLVMGADNAVFSMTFDHGPGDTRHDLPIESSRGFLEVARCGQRKDALATASIDGLSPRAVLSFLVLVGDTPAPSSLERLRHRQAGAMQSAPLLGPRPLVGKAPERLASKKRAHALASPRALVEGQLEADETGAARQSFSAIAGCHAFEVLDASDTAGLADVDARVLDAEGRTLALDGSTAPDASVSLCLGEAGAVRLDVRGSRPHGPLAWLHASWSLPEGLPPEWGPRARGRLAETLHRGRWPAVSNLPIAATLGVQGNTSLAVPVLPGGCYIAAVAALAQRPERLGLAARAGGLVRHARARNGQDSASLAVCATGPLLNVEVQSLGPGASFILGVWEIGATRP